MSLPAQRASAVPGRTRPANLSSRRLLVARGLLLFLTLYPLALIAFNLDKIGTGLPGVLAFSLAQMSFGIVGYVVAVRRPANPVGWLMIGIGLVLPSAAVLGRLARSLAEPAPTIAGVVVVLSNITGTPLLFGLVLLTLLLFPTGRIPARLWRLLMFPFAILYALFTFVGLGLEAETVGLRNPLYVEGLRENAPAAVVALPIVLVFGSLAILTAPVWRWWRAVGTERSQLKWVAVATVLAVVVLLSPGPSLLRLNLALSLLPAAVGIAILRDKLFDIDFVINRTALYGVVALVLAVAFEVLVTVVERLLPAAQRDQLSPFQPVLVLAVLPAFRPLERAVRPIANRFLPTQERLALLFTDIVGSTEVVSAIGDARWRDVLSRYYAQVRDRLREHRGTEVGTSGDGFFATFHEPLDAARCALAVVTSRAELDVQTRAGVHLGDCDMRGEQPAGLNVHLAARVMAASSGGTVLASESFRDTLGDGTIAFEPLGPFSFKGIPGQIHVYRVDEVRRTSEGLSTNSDGPSAGEGV